MKFSARGGGRGTNGQSLSSGIIVDVSRHMNQVLEIVMTKESIMTSHMKC